MSSCTALVPVEKPRLELVKQAVSELMSQPECTVCGRQYEQTLETLDHCARCRAEIAKANAHQGESPVFVHCRRNGEIVVSSQNDEGNALFLLEADPDAIKRALPAIARLAYDSVTWLVPGVPEANTQDAAQQAVWDFQDRLAAKLHTLDGEKR